MIAADRTGSFPWRPGLWKAGAERGSFRAWRRWLFRRFYVYVHRGGGLVDVWSWNGRRQTLLFRNHEPALSQPALADLGIPFRGRVFRLERGAPVVEVLFVPKRHGLLRLPPAAHRG